MSFLDEAREAFRTWETPSDIVVFELEDDYLMKKTETLNPTIEVSKLLLPILRRSLVYKLPKAGQPGYISIEDSMYHFKKHVVGTVIGMAHTFRLYSLRDKINHDTVKSNAFIEDCIKIGIIHHDSLSNEVKKELLKSLAKKYGVLNE
jgi:hypothetical protein